MFYHYFMCKMDLEERLWGNPRLGGRNLNTSVYMGKSKEFVLTSEFNIFDLTFRSQGTDMNNQADAY